MLESKFLFVSKILFLAYFIINIPVLLPVKFFDASYYFVTTTTLLDTATLLVLSLSVSKYVYTKNLKLLNNLNIEGENEDEFIKKIETLKKQLFNKSRLSFIIAIFFLLITLIQPIIMIFNLNKSGVYSNIVVESISKDFNNKKQDLKNLISKNKFNKTEQELEILEKRILQLSALEENNIRDFLKNNDIKKFENTKIIIRNIFLSLLWSLVFYKIYKI